MTPNRREFLQGLTGGIVMSSGMAHAASGGNKMKPGERDVLLVVDVQNDFIPGGAWP